jgi:hypothetical protein
MLSPTVVSGRRVPWNKGKPVGQKAPLTQGHLGDTRLP